MGLKTNLWDGKTLSAFIQERYEVPVGVRQCQRLFRRLGFRLRKPRPVIARADAQRKRRTKKTPKLDEHGEKDVWSLDEVHFQQYGSRCRMWVPPETQDPILLHHPGRKSVGYFGAVRLRDGKFVSHRQTGRFNGESFYVFLKRLRRITARSPSPVVVLADNASYHHAKLHQPWRERASQRFALDYLPPYSPDLNPIERVWKLTRRTCVHNRYFPKLEEVINAVDELFSTWAKGNDTLRRLCAII